MRKLAEVAAAILMLHGAPAANAATKAEQKAAQSILKSLTLRDRVAQLVMGISYGEVPTARSPEYERYRHWIKDLHIGGLLVINRVQYGLVRTAEPYALALFLNQMQRMSKVPLLMGGDFERGASMRVSDTTKFPFAMAYGAARDLDATRYAGLMTAREARALGIQWVFAPDSDVNNNPANPVINIRSYGENPDDVAAHVAAFIEGAHADPKNMVLLSAKHFPGHGDTDLDSHTDLPSLTADRDRIETVEMKPFEAAIAHGVDSVMTAHIMAPALDSTNVPATVSRRVLTGLLREELGFKGLIVTDAMNMAGITKQFVGGEASVRAIEAGADVLLAPPNPEMAIRAVVAAVEKGRITRQRIDESARRVLEAKVHVGLTKSKLVDLEAIGAALDSPEETAHAQSVSDRAVTLVRNAGDAVPLTAPDQACLVVSSGIRLSAFGQKMAEEFHKRAPQARVAFVDNFLPEVALDAVLGDTAACSAIVFATFTTNPVLNGELAPFVQKLTEDSVPVVFVSFGNPYLVMPFSKVAAYLATFNTAPTGETAAVKALLGEIAVTGKLPVTIPEFGQYGDGIQLPSRPKTRSYPPAN
ncbi:MAG TPA: glycoside hydrolase family 3 N-terminal domain-containing protein [Bryobacteraceae bacterium]|nr:glycoside hydrolase family 3 N-terminal domain-containing protein [Bryobacteraceae bacterium]